VARGRLIAFEGGEGCGKSTQAARLAARTGALLTREPGGTVLGETLRHLVLDHGEGPAFDARAETLVMLAARAQHVAEVVAPALDAGQDVVTDRFSHSTLAYQGYGRGLDVEELRLMCTWAARGIWPDAVVLLDVAPDVADRRRGSQADRLESAGRDFHDRVAAGFRDLAGRDPDRWVVADGTGTIEEVEARVVAGLAQMGIR
jgi:dTMP kinase